MDFGKVPAAVGLFVYQSWPTAQWFAAAHLLLNRTSYFFRAGPLRSAEAAHRLMSASRA
jgi:hypothetical protein